jgi:hypothetical protein
VKVCLGGVTARCWRERQRNASIRANRLYMGYQAAGPFTLVEPAGTLARLSAAAEEHSS